MAFSNILEFNTGRWYSTKGQRIAAIEVDGPFDLFDFDSTQHVLFVDYDRGITGKIDFCELTEDDIMRAYDKGRYSHIPTESRSLEQKLHDTFS